MSQKILNKRSSVFGKAPLPSQIEVGEIAINFNHENPFLSILDSNGEIQKFLSETNTRGLIQDAKEDIDNSFYTKEEINNMFEAFDPSGEVDLDLYYTKVESDAKYQTLSGMSSYLTVASAEGLYQPKGNYLTEHQSLENYYTKSEADGKFLTSHQDLSGYAQKSDLDDYLTIASASTIYATKEELEEHIPTVDAYTKAETDTLLAGKANSAHTHDYSQIQNTPDLSNFATKGEIPDISGFATKQELEDYQMKSGMTSYLTIAQAEQDLQPKGTYVVPSDLNDYALKSEVPDSYTKTETDNLLAGKANSAHTHSYTALTDLPDLSIYLTEHQDISGLATKAELENYMPNSGMTDYALKSEIPSLDGLATEAELANYMSLSGMSGYSEVNHTHDYSEIQNTPDLSGYASLSDVPEIWKGTLAEYTNLTEIDNDTLYVITDESEQFVTSGDVESMISGFTNLTEVQTLLEGYSTTAHTHDYSEILNTPDLSGFASLSDIPDTSNFITSGFCEDRYQPKGTYVVPSDLDDYALKSEVPDSYTKTETDNLLAGKANSAHTHTVSEITDLVIPSLEGYATEAELANYQLVSGMSDYVTDSELNTTLEGYSTTAHTHSQYLTETSADTRYARVVSLTQAQYDALVQNDQVEQGVLYCIIEQSNS